MILKFKTGLFTAIKEEHDSKTLREYNARILVETARPTFWLSAKKFFQTNQQLQWSQLSKIQWKCSVASHPMNQHQANYKNVLHTGAPPIFPTVRKRKGSTGRVRSTKNTAWQPRSSDSLRCWVTLDPSVFRPDHIFSLPCSGSSPGAKRVKMKMRRAITHVGAVMLLDNFQGALPIKYRLCSAHDEPTTSQEYKHFVAK